MIVCIGAPDTRDQLSSARRGAGCNGPAITAHLSTQAATGASTDSFTARNRRSLCSTRRSSCREHLVDAGVDILPPRLVNDDSAAIGGQADDVFANSYFRFDQGAVREVSDHRELFLRRTHDSFRYHRSCLEEMGGQVPRRWARRDERRLEPATHPPTPDPETNRTPNHQAAVQPRWDRHRIAYHLQLARYTAEAVLRRYRMPQLAHLDPATGLPVRRQPARRYEHERPGDLVHVDIKKLGRIPDGGGHRKFGRTIGNRHNKKQGRGYAFLHHAVTDHSRLAYSEILGDERKETAAGFWTRAAAYFTAHDITIKRVLTDNSSCYTGV